MKAKLKNGLIVDVRVYMLNSGLGESRTLYMDNDRGITYYESELEFLPDTHKQVTIEGYVARDEDGLINLFDKEPERICDCAWAYYPGHSLGFSLPRESFPEVTWESEPKRVRITLTPMEE